MFVKNFTKMCIIAIPTCINMTFLSGTRVVKNISHKTSQMSLLTQQSKDKINTKVRKSFDYICNFLEYALAKVLTIVNNKSESKKRLRLLTCP